MRGRNMSTTFSVLPGNNKVPTFREIIELSNSKLKEFLYDLGIFHDIKLKIQLRKKDESIVKEAVLDDYVVWDNDYYAWFVVDGIPGGTDAYYWHYDDMDLEVWKEEIETNRKASLYADKINRSLEIGYYWSFRRSAGQPGIICLAYGLIAATLCELTDGLIYSSDGAWNYSMFPAEADEFFSKYFKLESMQENEDIKWAKSCIESIYYDLKER